MMTPTLSPCQQSAYRLLTATTDNIFLTGRAGTGKSYLIRQYIKTLNAKMFPIVASTGAAAILVGGRTFHSFFGLGIMEGGIDAAVTRALKNRRVMSRLRKIHGVVIDEISMITGPALRAAELIARGARKPTIAWGGLRVIAVGDFSQLPPVTRGREAKPWAFLDEAWSLTDFQPAILDSTMRCDDEDYNRILNAIREGEVDESVESYLEEKYGQEFDPDRTPHLFAHRARVATFNEQRLAKVVAPMREYCTEYEGAGPALEALQKNAPIPEILQLKRKALVMIRINDPAMRFINGSLGTIAEIDDEALTIDLENGRTVEIEPHTFSYMNADGDVVATATNFPVTLAYATTIHKAQGATMDSLACDLSNLWEPGQAYVALSRLKAGHGLHLLGWNRGCIKTDPAVQAFHAVLRGSSPSA